MTSCEKIISVLKQKQSALCDDCLVKLTGVSPRQQINQICNRETGVFLKITGLPCSECGKIKITRKVR